MKLRDLEQKDAPLMLEWMHDPSVTENLQANFAAKSQKDCEQFIINAKKSLNDLHKAIVDDQDTYMGTVSLKNITSKDAEFAITVRTCAMGKGYSFYGMREIIRLGFEELNLEYIYWCVSRNNQRALHFYDKNGYQRIQTPPANLKGYTKQQINSYLWYQETRKTN